MSIFLKPKEALNKAFLKVKPIRNDIELFKTNLKQLIDLSKNNESEEHHKNNLSDFLKKTYYDNLYFINTKSRNDLVIHNGANSSSTVGVIIEAKKPSNKSEMLSTSNINTKALQELLLYFLRERITNNNNDIKNLIATNIQEWFIFDAQIFEKCFTNDKKLIQKFTDFEDGKLTGITTEFFYSEIAKPFIQSYIDKLEYTYFKLEDYSKALYNDDLKDDVKLISLYKLLSPEHLLKLPFANDSNTLDKKFYNELLHIIGLEEVKDGGKKVISRKKEGERNYGSLLENTIYILEDRDKLNYINNLSRFGEKSERAYNVALELCITWINRILFLKLLESQLFAYNKGDDSYKFLNINTIPNYDALDTLFFSVLAKKESDRHERIRDKFAKIPYLNSSLFEQTELESVINVTNLDNNIELEIYNETVLKDTLGKKQNGKKDTLQYLFEFLEAYDFTSEGSEDIQEENKSLINASVLGLIFEKINGYKDGSFFTPGFITMYMCRETIRRAVVQKFNEANNWNCKDYNELYNKIDDINQANQIINSLKICDPAVGSGHFLVSALNEIIAIKQELQILIDKDGKRLKNYKIEVVNDELIITDEDGELFEYNPKNPESQRIQETLFNEKQTIIENCLFGVDINPNSVKICRLRLWIELLKNAYYKAPTSVTERSRSADDIGSLETLPNIDINIKTGNSLISRFPIDINIKDALKNNKSWNIESYKYAVSQYRNATNKDEKRKLIELINQIKTEFRSEVSQNDPKRKRLKKLMGELETLHTQTTAFERTKAEQKKWDKDVKTKSDEISKLEKEIQDIESNQIYHNAFEWRFEFPEVLDNEGNFIGFDVVIGNPPYGLTDKFTGTRFYYSQKNYNLYTAFLDLSEKISKSKYNASFIIPTSWLAGNNFRDIRVNFIEKKLIDKIIQLPYDIFDVYVDTLIIILSNVKRDNLEYYKFNVRENFENKFTTKEINYKNFTFDEEYIIFLDNKLIKLLKKYNSIENVKLGEISKIQRGSLPPKPFQLRKSPLQDDIPWFNHQVYRYEIKLNEKVYVDYNCLKENKLMEVYSSEKIIGRQLISRQFRMQFTYLNDLFAFKKNLYAIYNLHQDYNYYFILGILNSNFYSFVQVNYNTSGQRDDFPAFSLQDYKNFKIPKITQEQQQPIIDLVDKILEAKKAKPTADTSHWETEIDQLVYKLYDLTEEEIKIIEEG